MTLVISQAGGIVVLETSLKETLERNFEHLGFELTDYSEETGDNETILRGEVLCPRGDSKFFALKINKIFQNNVQLIATSILRAISK